MAGFLSSLKAVICVILLAITMPISAKRPLPKGCGSGINIYIYFGWRCPSTHRMRRSDDELIIGDHSVDDTCALVMEEAGLNSTTFMEGPAHGIHSITVEDLKYYFDPSFPNDNDIPTVNTNLRGQHVLFSARFGSEFQTPAMRMMDFILSNDDGKDNFLLRSLTPIEKIAHGMHMIELWHITSDVYKKIKANPPKSKVCSCVTDEARNGIFDELKRISIYLRNLGTEEPTNNELDQEISSTSNNELDGNTGRVKRSLENTTMDEMDEIPVLKDAKSWKTWKKMLKGSMLDDNQIYDLALYLYCKIAALKKYY